MSDTRYISNSIPHDISYRHRLNIPYRNSKSIIRERPKFKPEKEIISESFDQSDLDISFTHPGNGKFISTPMFDNDEEFEEYLDAELGESTIKYQHEDHVIKVYKSACNKFKVIPNMCVKKGLMKQTLKCKFLNLTLDDCKSICCALHVNRYVEKLEFQQNGMGPLPANLFADVIRESVFLTHIKLADNDLKSVGAMAICDAVSNNKLIRCLDLSGNGLVEKDGEFIEKLIKSSSSLKELYLGHNELMDTGVKRIAAALEVTYTLRVIDVSWNHIRLKGAVALGDALTKNASLEIVNLAWNGFHLDGAKSIADALKKNSTLESLDLTCNRMSEYCIAQILLGLRENSTLEVLRIGQNHVTTKGAFTILEQLCEYKNSAIKLFDLGKQEVDDRFVDLYNKMKIERDIEILYGEVWKTDRTPFSKYGVNDDEVALMCCNPLLVLMECMRLQNLRLIDFFKSLDTDKSNLICINELCDGMMKVGIPIRRDTLLKLLHKLDTDNNDRLDYGEMVEAQNKHRKYMRKALANAEEDLERTEVGRVTALLRKLMGRNFVMKKDDGYGKSKRGKKSRCPSTSSRVSSATTERNSEVKANHLSDRYYSSSEELNGCGDNEKVVISSRRLSLDLSENLYQRLNVGTSSQNVSITLRPPSVSSDESGIDSRPSSGSSAGSYGRMRMPSISSNLNLVTAPAHDVEPITLISEQNMAMIADSEDSLPPPISSTKDRRTSRRLSTTSLCSRKGSIW
ncbi:hypothetical protein ACF0H5_000663 [Mactra antiquata]